MGGGEATPVMVSRQPRVHDTVVSMEYNLYGGRTAVTLARTNKRIRIVSTHTS